jgi:NAD(P)-dependent dehydrogenase (short-subunit alcohol dehydrogenase family)
MCALHHPEMLGHELIVSGIYPDLVVVTGAGRGIGRAIALDAGRRSFVLCISQSERALQTAASIREAGGEAHGIALDLSDSHGSEAVVKEWLLDTKFSRISAVFAAAVLGPQGKFIVSDLQDWERTFRVNLFGNLAIAHAILPIQVKNHFGRLLFFAGGGAAYAYPVFPAYGASKAALVRIVENLHEDLKDQGNFATAILAPGAVETDTLASVRASGAEVRTTVDIEEPVAFAREFICSETCNFSGRFVHVRDEWKRHLNSDEQPRNADLWKLRRTE